MWLCTTPRRKTLSALALRIGNATIQPTGGAHNLGVSFGSLELLTSNSTSQTYVDHATFSSVTACHAMITTIGHSTDYSACVRAIPPGLLQLANGRTAVMWHTVFAVSPERCCTSLWRRVQTRQCVPSTSR